MRTLSIIAALAATTFCAPNYQLVWSEDFDYTGLPDESKWDYNVGGNGWGNNELQFYKRANPKNVWVSNGEMKITVLKEDTTYTSNGVQKTNPFSSTRLVTKGKAGWKYGRLEARMKLPRGTGMWPAFWMMPVSNTYGGWPKSGEIDIVENYAVNPTVMWGSAHMAANYGATSKTAATLAENPNDSFHIYSLDWRPDTLTVSVDGRAYFQYANPHTGWESWPFDQDFYIILNVAVQQSYFDANAPLPQSLTVDWVRVYQDGGSVVAPPPPPTYTVSLSQTTGGTVSVSPVKASYNAGEKVQIKALPDNGYVFSGWLSGSTSTAAVDSIAMDANKTLRASFTKVGSPIVQELIPNGNFDQGWTGWKTYYEPTMKPTFELRDGMACIHPGGVGQANWYTQISYSSFPVVANTDYALSFSAKAKAKRVFTLYLSKGVSPYDDLTAQPRVLVDTVLSRQTITLRALQSDAAARLEVDVALDTAEICLDDISLSAINHTASVQRDLGAALRIVQSGRDLSVVTSTASTWTFRSLNGAAMRSGAFAEGGTHAIKDLPAGLVGILTLESDGARRSVRVSTL